MTRTESDIQAALSAGDNMPIDVDATLMAVRSAAGHRRRRRVVVSSAAAVLVVGAGVPAVVALHPFGAGDRTGQPIAEPTSTGAVSTGAGFSGSCTVEVLPLPAEVAGLEDDIVGNIQVADMDPTGRYTVGYANASNNGDPFVIRWDGTVPAVLPVHAAMLTAGSVNSAGDVVGQGRAHKLTASYVPEGYAWLYAGGAMSTLPTPDGYAAAGATAINDTGQITGFAEHADGTSVTVVWDADAAHTVHVLDSPGSEAVGVSIAANGTVVGVVRTADPEPETFDFYPKGRPYAWGPDGAGRFLPMPDGDIEAVVHKVRGQFAVGETFHPAGAHTGMGGQTKAYSQAEGVLWNLQTGEMSIVDSDEDGIALAVNSGGDIAFASSAEDSNGQVTYRPPVLVRGGQSYHLPLLEPSAKYAAPDQFAFPVALSEDATVIVARYTSNVPVGAPTPVVRWHC